MAGGTGVRRTPRRLLVVLLSLVTAAALAVVLRGAASGSATSRPAPPPPPPSAAGAPSPLPPSPLPPPSPSASPPPAALGLGTQSTLVLHRDGSPTPRPVRIWRPPVPDSARLPVVYLLHGVPGSPDDPFDAGLAEAMDRWVAQGGAPFVVAAPDGGGDTRDDTEWADAVDGTDQVETYVLQTVIPAVEGDHPRPAALRAVAGFSMGGYGALDLALRHPGTFASVVSLAGYAHLDDPDGVFGGRADVEAAHEPARLIGAAGGMRFFLGEDDGDDEPAVAGQAMPFAAQLRAAGVSVHTEITEGDHSWEWAMAQWPAVQAWLAAGWPAPAS